MGLVVPVPGSYRWANPSTPPGLPRDRHARLPQIHQGCPAVSPGPIVCVNRVRPMPRVPGVTPMDLALGHDNVQVPNPCPLSLVVHVRDCAAWARNLVLWPKFCVTPASLPPAVDRAPDGCRTPFVVSRDISRKQGVPYLAGILHVVVMEGPLGP